MNDDFSTYYNSIYIHYSPFYEIKNHKYYCIYIKEIRNFEVKNLIKKVTEKSLFCGVNFYDMDHEKYKISFYFNSDYDQIFKVLKLLKDNDIIYEYYIVDFDIHKKIIDREHAKFFYWKVFDPENIKWLFKKDNYIFKSKSFYKRYKDEVIVGCEPFSW
jgi:hypothetical protein